MEFLDRAVDRRGHLDLGFVRFDLRDRLILGDGVALVDEPPHEFALRDALSDVR